MNSTTVVSWSDASFLPVLKMWSRHYRRTRPDRMPVVIYTKQDDALEPQRRACAPCKVVALPRERGEAMLRWRLRTVVHALSGGGGGGGAERIFATDLDAIWWRDPLAPLLPHLPRYEFIGSQSASSGKWPLHVWRRWDVNFTFCLGWYVATRALLPIFEASLAATTRCRGEVQCNDQTAVNEQLVRAGLDGPDHWRRLPPGDAPLEWAATLLPAADPRGGGGRSDGGVGASIAAVRVAAVSRGFVCRGNCDKPSGGGAAVKHVMGTLGVAEHKLKAVARVLPKLS